MQPRIPLLGRLVKPVKGLQQILCHAMSLQIIGTECALGRCIALLGGAPVPVTCPRNTLGNPFTHGIPLPDNKLRDVLDLDLDGLT